MYIIVHEGKRLAICGRDGFSRLRQCPVGSEMRRVSDGALLATLTEFSIFRILDHA